MNSKGESQRSCAHRDAVGTAVVDLELFVEVFERKERVAAVEAFLVFAVAALHFAIVPGRIGANQLVPYAEPNCGSLKQGWQVFL